MPCGVWIQDSDGRILDMNPAALRILGLDRQAVSGASSSGQGGAFVIRRADGSELPDSERPSVVVARTGAPVHNMVLRLDRVETAPKWIQVDSIPIRGPSGAAERIVTTFTDITEQALAELAARDSEARFRAVFDRAGSAIATIDLEGRLLTVNPALSQMLGREGAELIGTAIWKLGHPTDFEPALFTELIGGSRTELQQDVRWLHSDGSYIWGSTTATVVRDEEGQPLYVVGIVEDVTARREREAALRRQVLYDGLSRLPNRVLFEDRMQQAILGARRESGSLAILVLDLDDFRSVNEQHGHAAGDDVLKEVAGRLRTEVRASDTVARIGSDEFAVILATGGEASAAALAARALESALSKPYRVGDLTVEIGVSVGISLHPEHGDDPEVLLRRAEVAVRAAKRDATGYAFYQPTDETGDRLAVVSELRRAVTAGDIVLHYQPVLGAVDRRVVGVEALARWRRGGVLLEPKHFIGVAEQSGLIRHLAYSTLAAAVVQAGRWRAAGLDLMVAVNLSARNLHDAELPDLIARLLSEERVPATSLKIELTETALMSDPERVIRILEPMSSMGVRVAVDDFGTGYSSLAYLRRLPVDEIKIDRSFVSEMRVEDEAAVIVRSMIDLGHNLGLSVTAEGVEDPETWEMLVAARCDFVQGYLPGAPGPADAIAIAARRPHHA